MLTVADELPHTPPDPLPERWQENYFVLGYDAERDAAFTVHVERFPEHGVVEVKADVAIGADVVSVTSEHPLPDAIGGGVTAVDVIEPFHRWRLRHDGMGHAGRGPLGFVGHGGAAREPARIGIDVTLESPIGAVDHAELLRALAMPGTERDHYETCGTWNGRLRVGDLEVEGHGLFVRDHTWGSRQYTKFSGAWWYPSCLDDGATYVGGALVSYDGKWGGYVIVADADGVEGSTDVAIEADGVLEPGGYGSTVLTASVPGRPDVRITSTTRVHLPHYFSGFADRYYCNDALCSLEWDAKSGFGVRELNAYLSVEEARDLATMSA